MSFLRRSWLVSLAAAACALAIACGGETRTAGGPAPPLGPGYGDAGPDPDDLRTLSRDDCILLRDHLIEINVASAIGEADPGERLTVEAEVRARMKAETDAWLKRCAGRLVHVKDWRCMKEATTTEAFLACGSSPDEPDAG